MVKKVSDFVSNDFEECILKGKTNKFGFVGMFYENET